MTWEEFKEDNPFNLTEVQYTRIRKYIEPVPRRAKKYEIGGPWIWTCNICGSSSRFGSKKRGSAGKSARDHFRNKHPGEKYDYRLSVDEAKAKNFNHESRPVKWEHHYRRLRAERSCFGEHDDMHNFCNRICAIRIYCAKYARESGAQALVKPRGDGV